MKSQKETLRQNIRQKNEIVQPKPFKEIEETNEERYKRYNLDPNQIQNLDLMGTITSIMSDYIVVESRNYQVLDLDNILFTQDKMILGQIDDVFGRIEVPVYSIINDGFLMKQVREGKIKVGDGVYYDREHSRILPQEQINLLRSKKGTDASNKFDEEVLLEEEIEFSDDEKEEAYRAERAALKKAQKKAQSNTNPSKPKKAEKSEKKLVQQAQKMNSTIVYNQGMAYAIQPTYIMPQQPMPMNMMMMNPGMMAQPLAQPLFYPMQNAPLQFNPMFNQNNMVNNTGYTPQPLLGQQPQFFQNGFNNNNSNTLNKGFFN